MARPRRSFSRHHHPQPRFRTHHRAYPRTHSKCRRRTHRVAGPAIRLWATSIVALGSKHAQAEAQRDEAVQIPPRETVRVRGSRPDYPGPRYPIPSRRAHAAIPRQGTSPGNRVSPRCTNPSAVTRCATLYSVAQQIIALTCSLFIPANNLNTASRHVPNRSAAPKRGTMDIQVLTPAVAAQIAAGEVD